MNNEILFRLTAGDKYGLGHLSRNLVLANIFFENNFSCKFIIETDNKKKILSFIKSKTNHDYGLVFLKQGISLNDDIQIIHENYILKKSFLILDHYNHDITYHKKLKKANIKWAQFDYKKKNTTLANVIINANIGVLHSEYLGLVNQDAKLCIGEKYAIINTAFKKTKQLKINNRILIAFGGGEYSKEITELIKEVISNKDYIFDIITSQDIVEVEFQYFNNIEIHNNPINIADIYARNQIAIVAGGVTTYELAYLKIPMILIPFAHNQLQNAILWDKFHFGISFLKIQIFIKDLKKNGLEHIISELNKKYVKRNVSIDGNGAERIVQHIKDFIYEKKY